MRRPALRIPALALAALLASSAAWIAAGPAPVAAAAPVPRIAAGFQHSLAIDDSGNVWAFGDNAYGQIGDGTTTRRFAPVMVYTATSARKAVSVAAGDSHSLILLSDRTVWAFGANPSSSLSTSSSAAKILSAAPVRLQNGGTLSGAVAIGAGGTSSAALLADGSVVVWGKALRPTAVQLDGAGQALKGLVGVSVGTAQVVVLKSDGTVYQTDAASPAKARQVLVHSGAGEAPLAGIASVSAGKGFAVAVSRSGLLYSFGSAASGVLGRDTGGTSDPVAGPVLAAAGGEPLSGVASADCGPDHVVAVLAAGSLMGWGYADGGRLGRTLSGTIPYPVPVALSGASEVAVGNRHVLARSSTGTVWAFGSNAVGQADGESQGVLDPHVVTMTTNLWLNLSPTIKVVKVTETSISLSWRSSDLYVDNIRGFLIRWSRPDGTVGETFEMPEKTRGVTLGNLQPGTNHTIRVVALGAGAAAEEAPAIVVQTLPGVTPSISPDATPGATGEATPGEGTPAPATPTPTGGPDASAISEDLAATYRGILNTVLLAGVVLAVVAVALKVIAWRAAHRDVVRKDRDG